MRSLPKIILEGVLGFIPSIIEAGKEAKALLEKGGEDNSKQNKGIESLK